MRCPDGGEVGAEDGQVVALGLREHARAFPLAARQLGLGGLERGQAFLPRSLKAGANRLSGSTAR